MRNLNRLINTGQPVKLMVVSDIHIDSTVNGNAEADGAIREDYKYFYDVGRRLQQFRAVANAQLPDYVICLGDMVESYSTDNFTIFNTQWNLITRPKILTVGNHEFASGVYDDVVTQVGYTANDTVAGSRFNKSFSVANSDSSFSIRVIMLDAQINREGEHTSLGTGYIQSDALAWLEGELGTCTENFAVLCSHEGPHTKYFDATQATAVSDMVDRVLTDRPSMKIMSLYGHNHGNSNVVVSDKFGGRYLGFLTTSLLDYSKGSFIDMKIYQNGKVKYKTISV